MSQQERDHDLMEKGTQATLVAGYIRDTVDDIMRTKVTLLIAMYRQGNIDHDALVGPVAEIAALDELMAELENRQRRADTAAQRELGSGKTIEDLTESVLRGGLEHGQDMPDDATNNEMGEYDDDEDEGQEDNTQARAPADPLELMQREIDMLKSQNTHLQRMIPPPAPVQTSDSQEDDDDIDWDNLIFSNPKEAVKKIKEQAVNEAGKNLRREYQQDVSETKFWVDFYKANADLEVDKDLVEVTLQSNLSKLGDLPVTKAMEQLADLTRQRIMRYSGVRGKSKSRAVAEGASPPSKHTPEPKKVKATTLSDIIKTRRETRRKAASAVKD